MLVLAAAMVPAAAVPQSTSDIQQSFVPHFEVEHAPFHTLQVAIHQTRVEDHDEQREAHGGDGHPRAASVPPDVPPGHLHDPQGGISFRAARAARSW